MRVVVVSVPFGGGHRAVAEALGHGLRCDSMARRDVKVVDGLEAISKFLPLATFGMAAYLWLSRPRVRCLYRLLYEVADRRPTLFGALWYRILGRRVRAWLVAERPDVVVSTHPFVSFVLSEAIAATRSEIRLVVVVTDAGCVNRSWFSGRLDAVLVSDHETYRFGRGLMPSMALYLAPLPLRPGFQRSSAKSRERARHAFGLGEGRAVLIWGGGSGIARGMLELADAFRSSKIDATPIFVCGGNRRLAARLSRRAPRHARVFGQVNDVPTLLGAVDVVLGKPGWVSLSEAAATGLHTICFDSLPGQEVENLRIAVGNGSASWEPDALRAVRTIDRAPSPCVWPTEQFVDRLTSDVVDAIMGQRSAAPAGACR